MLNFLLIFLLISNAVTVKRDKSILFSRIVIKSLLFTAFIAYSNLHVAGLEKGIGILGGLFSVSTFTQSFNIFILLISSLILTLSAFFPRKVYLSKNSTIYELLNIIRSYRVAYYFFYKDNKRFIFFAIFYYSLIFTAIIFLFSEFYCLYIYFFVSLVSTLFLVHICFINTTLRDKHPLIYFSIVSILILIIFWCNLVILFQILIYFLDFLLKMASSSSKGKSSCKPNTNNSNNKKPTPNKNDELISKNDEERKKRRNANERRRLAKLKANSTQSAEGSDKWNTHLRYKRQKQQELDNRIKSDPSKLLDFKKRRSIANAKYLSNRKEINNMAGSLLDNVENSKDD